MKQLLASLVVLALLSGCGSSSSKKSSSPEQNTSNPTTDNNNSQEDNSTAQATAVPAPKGDGKYRLLAWNDLGMHCMDGDDYSVFSILPPYNNLVAQLVEKKDGDAEKISSGVTLTYQAVPSLDGKLNTTSHTKTNFWDYVKKLFGKEVAKDVGLKGSLVQSTTPHPLKFDSTNNWWTAEGIPTSPKNDDGSINRYPMVRVVARDASGTLLAASTAVLPVSDEMDCSKCHKSNGSGEAKPNAGWVNNADAQKDYKENILRLHDDKHNIASYISALQAKGYTYETSLAQTAKKGTPILCAACHKSNALPGSGLEGLPALTKVLHDEHAGVVDPSTGQRLDDANNRNACYACHPGSSTQCLRGAMGKAKNADGSLKMQCQSCHGGMKAVGKSGRDGWLDEPNCQNCHQGGKRHTEAVTDLASGSLRAVLDNRFATTPNKPASGKSLYRYSTGHGGLQCSACHGSTHAIYPSLREEDNKQSMEAQGHTGTIAECTTCHTTVPRTTNEGPHGMHTVGERWVKDHRDVAEHNNQQCKACHGNDFRGSPLSEMFSARKLDGKDFARGHQVSCYDCHDGPDGG